MKVFGSRDYLPPFRCNLLSLMPDVVWSESDSTSNDGVLFLTVYLKLPKQLSNSVDPMDSTNSSVHSFPTNDNQQNLVNELINSVSFMENVFCFVLNLILYLFKLNNN